MSNKDINYFEPDYPWNNCFFCAEETIHKISTFLPSTNRKWLRKALGLPCVKSSLTSLTLSGWDVDCSRNIGRFVSAESKQHHALLHSNSIFPLAEGVR